MRISPALITFVTAGAVEVDTPKYRQTVVVESITLQVEEAIKVSIFYRLFLLSRGGSMPIKICCITKKLRGTAIAITVQNIALPTVTSIKLPISGTAAAEEEAERNIKPWGAAPPPPPPPPPPTNVKVTLPCSTASLEGYCSKIVTSIPFVRPEAPGCARDSKVYVPSLPTVPLIVNCCPAVKPVQKL